MIRSHYIQHERLSSDSRDLRYLVEFEREEVEKTLAVLESNREGAEKWVRSQH